MWELVNELNLLKKVYAKELRVDRVKGMETNKLLLTTRKIQWREGNVRKKKWLVGEASGGCP